jgi:hypothetical protein
VILVRFNDCVSIISAMLLMCIVSIPITVGIEVFIGLKAANIAELIVTIIIYLFMTIQIQKIILANSQIDKKQKKFVHIAFWCGTVLLFIFQEMDIIQKVF